MDRHCAGIPQSSGNILTCRFGMVRQLRQRSGRFSCLGGRLGAKRKAVQ